jgi:AcrR family transcriptional regulator
MPRRRGVRGEARKRLIGAAAVCYGKGARGAPTINQVCAQANASVGSVYHHFPGGLTDLEDALYLDTLRSYQQDLLSELARHRTAAAGVKSMVTFHLDWMARNLRLAHYVCYFNTSWLEDENLERLEAMNEEFGRAANAWRKPHVESGHIRRLPVLVYGSIILGPAQQYGSEVIGRLATEELAGAFRDVGPALADAAWLAVKGQKG